MGVFVTSPLGLVCFWSLYTNVPLSLSVVGLGVGARVGIGVGPGVGEGVGDGSPVSIFRLNLLHN